MGSLSDVRIPRSRLVLPCTLLFVLSCSSSASPAGRESGNEPSGPADPSSGAGSSSGKKPDAGRRPSSTADSGAPVEQAPGSNATTEITVEPIAIDDCDASNTAGISADDANKLKAGGGSASSMKWLYPYEGTVFPRGMIAPDLMWDGADGDVAYVHIKSKIFEYWGCVKPTAAGQIALKQDVWDKAGQRSQGKQDVYTLELSLLSQGKVTGPVTSHFQISQAAIKGSVYYNSYNSKLTMPADPQAQGGGGFGDLFGGLGSGGVVLRIPPGGRAEVFGQTDCNGCHSVSADGSRLLAQSVMGGAYSYSLVAGGPAPTPTMAGSTATWTALYPDGSAFLSMSSVIDVARAGSAGFGGGLGGGSTDATLHDATNGNLIPNVGIPPGTLMPSFSPDGSHLVFNDYAVDQAHGLALMKYDTKTHTATEYTVLQQDKGDLRPGWPFALPDNDGVVFLRTAAADFTGGGVGIFGAVTTDDLAGAPLGELSIVDVKSKQVSLLAKAMGYNTPADAEKGVTYLPFGAEDLHHTYYPTVSPVASGGYFWVFFDSIRHYGRLGLQRQLWGAAIDISADGTYTSDPSHPPFYLSGQEPGVSNHRAFATLDPCHKDGDACTSGIDCCGGFCYTDTVGEVRDPVGTCSPMRVKCSKREERCSDDRDCCPPANAESPASCIAGYCAFVPVL